MTTAFRDDPVAAHSAQFPLGQSLTAATSQEEPSTEGLRPWGLSGMSVPAPSSELPRLSELHYDPIRQVTVGVDGLPMMQPTAHSKSNNDGDEGPNEDGDWEYDFAPDEEPQPI